MAIAHLKHNYDLHRMQDQHLFLSHNHHHQHHHQQQQQLQHNRPKASRTHRSKVDNNVRSNWTDLAAAVCQPEAPVTLAEFAQCRQLPSVVRVVRGRFGSIGCNNGGGSQGELDSEIYVHSIGSTSDHGSEQRPADATVLAQVLRFEDSNDSRHNGGRGFNGGARNQGSGRRLVPTGRTVCLPIDGSDVRPGAGCWFELMSEDGRSAPPITSVKDLADRALSVRSNVLLRYLVRETVYGTVNNLNSATVSIHQGNTITPVRCVSSMDFASVEGGGSVDEMERFRQHRQNRKPDRLQCVDSMNRSLFLPLDQVGLFSPVADDSDRTAAIAGSVYDGLGSIVAAFRLPVTVRLVCGQLSVPNSGNSNGIQSSIFRLTAISQRLEGGSRRTASVESAVFVMSLRQAWSVDPRKKSAANSEDRLALTCIPQSAAGALLVESASQDFYSWLTSDDGLELGRRCDRIIATGNFHATTDADAARNATDDDRRQHHHSSITSPTKELQRRTSVDSGLASSAINDELYDEIDNIYCMIRYGAPVGAAGNFYCPEPDRYGRTKSFDNTASRPFDGFLLPPPHRPQRIDSKPEVGITIENFKQPTPSRGRMQTVTAVVTSTAAARCRQTKTDALDSNDRFNFNSPASRPGSRPPSRSGIANVETGLPNSDNVYARLDFDGRSEPNRSRKSSLVAYALENNRTEEVEPGACRKSTGFSPIAIAYSGMTSGIGEVFSDVEQGSGNADAATSGESAPPRKHSRMPSADDAAITNEVQQATNGGTRGVKSKNGRWTTHPVEQSHIDQMQQAVAAAEARQGTPGATPSSGNKRSAFSMALSRSLEALRRVTRRSVGNAAISTETEPDSLSPDPRHDRGQQQQEQQRHQSETNDLQPHGKKRSGLGGGSGGKTKNGKGSKQQTTWYDIDIENKTVYDDVDVFDYDIGDGRPNADVRREWFETARSRRSWAAPAVDGISFGPDSLRVRRRKPKDRGDDPPLMLATMFGERRQTKPSAIFDGYYSGRADDMQFTAGQYKSFGQF